MMLAGEKPLAYFSDAVATQPNEDVIPRQRFAPYVSSGQLTFREYVLLSPSRPAYGPHRNDLEVVLYAPRGEAWRIEAFILMQQTARQVGWSEGLERIQGALLGYLDWQIDFYLRKFFQRR